MNKNYFIAALGQVEGIKDDLLDIASNQPKYINSKNVFLSTFSSPLSIAEIKMLIRQVEGGVYFISEINDSTFDYFIPNQEHKEALFGEFKTFEASEEDHELFEDGTLKADVIVEDKTSEPKTMDILDLIDKGYENLTEEEKEFIRKNS